MAKQTHTSANSPTSINAESASAGPSQHPGEVLGEELEAREMQQKQLAEAVERSPSRLNDIIRGRKPITAEWALGFERVLGIRAELWLAMQNAHDLHELRKRAAS